MFQGANASVAVALEKRHRRFQHACKVSLHVAQYRRAQPMRAMLRRHIEHEQYVFHGVDYRHSDVLALESKDCATTVPG